MSIFQQLESMMASVMRTEEFEMDPQESKYQITFNGAPCCVVDFVNQKTEESDDFEIAQEEPGQYIVYLTNIKDKAKADEYQGKLKKMGFNKISVYEDVDPVEPEVESIQNIKSSNDIDVILKLLDNIEFEDADGLSLGSLKAIGDIRKIVQKLNVPTNETHISGEPGKEGSLDDEDMFKCTKCDFRGKYKDVSKSGNPRCPKCGAPMFNDEPYEESKNIEEEQINESSNEEVIDLFVNDNFPHDKDEASKMGIKRWMSVWGSENLKISKQNNGWALVNYNTPILFRDSEGKIYFNTDKYSVTTSKIQNQIRKSLSGKEFKEVDEKTIREKIK
jgi:predicted  nucleic acid-binding Zn-ribbon protein